MNDASERIFPASRSALAWYFSTVAFPLVILMPLASLMVWWAAQPSMVRLDPWLAGGIGGLGAVCIATGLIVAWLSWRVFRDRRLPVLRLDARGLHFGGRAARFVPWEALASVELATVRRNPWLLLTVRDPAAFSHEVSRLFGGTMPVGISLIGGQPGEVLAAIRSHPAYIGD